MHASYVYADLIKLSAADLSAEKTIHTLKSSNLPFYIAIWDAAKASKALVVLHRRFYWDQNGVRHTKNTQKRAALVDVVARDGDEWIKVSTTSEQRLQYELAKAQWESADSSDEMEDLDNEQDSSQFSSNSVLERMELVCMADDLRRASLANRIHYEHPQVRIVLPRISNPPPDDLVPLLERIRSTGAVLDLAGDMPQMMDTHQLETDTFEQLLPSVHPPLTRTLNIDCTILLALVSDLSHTSNFPVHPTYNAAIRRQIEVEAKEHLLPTYIWPGMAVRDLVCTEEAAKRMREIVSTIGTPNERIRTELVMEDGKLDESSDMTARQSCILRDTLQNFSDHPVPPSLRIPIRIQPAPKASDISNSIESGKLPTIAKQIAGDLSDINRSVFFFGWVHGFTTVSSNRTVTKAIESTIEKQGNGEKGPEIWLREPARSLLGKEKQRRK